MKKTFYAISIGILILTVAGCAKLEFQVMDRTPITMSPPTDDQQVVTSFSEETRAYWILWGLIPVSVPDTEDIILKHAQRGDGVASLNIQKVEGPMDILINIVGSIVIPIGLRSETITISGDVVKQKK